MTFSYTSQRKSTNIWDKNSNRVISDINYKLRINLELKISVDKASSYSNTTKNLILKKNENNSETKTNRKGP